MSLVCFLLRIKTVDLLQRVNRQTAKLKYDQPEKQYSLNTLIRILG